MWSRIEGSKGNLRFYWSLPPAGSFTTSGLVVVLQLFALLGMAAFAPLFSCPACESCGGSGALSAYQRWFPVAWRPRLRKGVIITTIALPLILILSGAGMIPYRPCEECPRVQAQNLENKDSIQGCGRCGNIGKIGFWNSLFGGD